MNKLVEASYDYDLILKEIKKIFRNWNFYFKPI